MVSTTKLGRRERSAQIRSDLLAGAERMLGDKGFERATISDITREAGLGFGTFYRYFPSKEEIYRELVSEGLAVLTAAIDERCARADDLRERLCGIVEEVVTFASARPELFLLISASGPGVREAVRRGVKDLSRNVRGWLEPGFADGTFEPVAPALAVNALIGMHAFVLRPWLYNRTLPQREVTDSLILLAEGALLNPLRDTAHTIHR